MPVEYDRTRQRAWGNALILLAAGVFGFVIGLIILLAPWSHL